MSEGDEFGPLPPQPKNWEQLFAITNGLKDVPIEQIEQGRVDWEYEFSSTDMRNCGRKGCEQKHAHGWLMALRGRRYVNIGNDCAKRYANVSLWASNVSSYRTRRKSDARDAAIVKVREQAQAKQYWLDNAPELDRAIALHQSFLQAARGPFLAEIEQRAEKRNSRVEREIRLTEEEREARRMMLSGSRLDSEPKLYVPEIESVYVADITGLQCFRPQRGPKDLRTRLQKLVETLLAWTPKEGDKDTERAMVRATRELGPYSNELNESLVATEQFFSDANLLTLMSLPITRAQGIVSIECDDQNKVWITRRPHWNLKAA